jgi:hypothetical protein
MTTHEQVQAYLEQPKRYYNIDGVGEISIGVMMLAYCLNSWMQALTPGNSVWHRMWFFLLYVVLMVGVIHFGAKFLKQRITYPRTGFVEYRRNAKARIVPTVLVVATTSAVVTLLISRHVNPAAMTGLILVPTYAYGFGRTVPWKWWVVAVMAAGSLAIASLPTGLLESIAHDSTAGLRVPPGTVASWLLESLFVGASYLVSGAIALCLYLSRTQAPEQAAE